MKQTIISKIFLMIVLLFSAGCNSCGDPIGFGRHETLMSVEAAEAYCKDKEGLFDFKCGYRLKCKNGTELR